jgi:hypothetical protein
MASKLLNGLTLPTIGATQPVTIPEPNTVTLFARDNNTIWCKFQDATEVLVSVG